MGFFAMSCYMLMIFYLQNTAFLDFKLWDLATVTAADFTCELLIHKKMWEEHENTMNYVEEMKPSYTAPSLAEMGHTAVPAL